MRIHSNQQELFDRTEMNIVFDIDGTLSDDTWRQSRRAPDANGKIDWDSYHREGKHDLPLPSMSLLYQSFASFGYGMILVTGRPIKYWKETRAWMGKHNLPYHSLFMRPENDFSSNERLKLRILEEHGLVPANVICVFDDNEKVISLLRDRGYYTFHVVMP